MPIAERSRRRLVRTGRVDWGKVDRTTDEDIDRQIAEDPDTAPELTEKALDRAVVVSPGGRRSSYRERVSKPRSGNLLQPGNAAPQSGRYELVGPRGKRAGQERTVRRGEPLPPTPEPGQRYRLVGSTEG